MMQNLADGRQIRRNNGTARGHVLEQFQRRCESRRNRGGRIGQRQHIRLPQQFSHAPWLNEPGERDTV
jgi:hypothetical protein